MMKNMKSFKRSLLLLIFSSILILNSCGYPEYEVEYSEGYPVCGEYYVRDFNPTGSFTEADLVSENYDWYKIYIYNKSYNPTGDSMWIDNSDHNPKEDKYIEGLMYKIKNKVDTVNKTFDCVLAPTMNGLNANATAKPKMFVTISESKIILNEWPIPDSIYLKIIVSDSLKVPYDTIITTGHRKTGWEFPEYSDPM